MMKSIERSLQQEHFSVMTSTCRIDQKQLLLLKSEVCSDFHSFRISVPYAGEEISWWFVFNPHSLDFPPDIFLDSTEDFDLDLSRINALRDWSKDKAASLMPSIAKDVLAQYSEYHQEKFKRWQRINFELESLMQSDDIPNENLEVFLKTGSDGSFLKANFMIKLKTDWPPLPTALKLQNPGSNYAVLLVRFTSPTCVNAVSHLYLSPGLQCAVKRAGEFSLPVFQQGSCLIDYVPMVTKRLVDKISSINIGLQERRSYINELISRFGRSVLEFDSDNFEKAVFLLDYNDFYFILELRLESDFPDSAPQLSFRSVYHTSTASGSPYVMRGAAVPFSPRWSGDENYTRLSEYLNENVPLFQRKSCLEGNKE